MCAQSDEAKDYPSLEGINPVVSTPAWILPGQLASAVLTEKSGHQDVVYVGTANGDLFKVIFVTDLFSIQETAKCNNKHSISKQNQKYNKGTKIISDICVTFHLFYMSLKLLEYILHLNNEIIILLFSGLTCIVN